ncbi:MAG: hypothetical protein HYX94_04185 [Chloroflexi bacterium]|nr:hypothetical protein [Chloroflexota bacterium]
MTSIEKPVKLTVSLDDKALYKAIRHAAIEQDRSIKEIVVEALRDWLRKQEEEEDLAAIAETEGEETYSWQQVKAEMREARDEQRDR